MKRLMSTMSVAVLILLSGNFNSQSQEWQWVKNAPTKTWQTEVNDIAKTPEGNFFITGYYNDSIYFGDSLYTSSNFGKDPFLAKLDNMGKYTWVSMFDTTEEHDVGQRLLADNEGNVYLLGKGSAGKINHEYPYTKMMLAKFDAEGNVLWNINVSGVPVVLEAKDWLLDQENNVWITGHFMGTFKIGEDSIVSTSSDMFLLKLSSEGTVQVFKKFGGVSPDEGAALDMDEQGNLYLGGSTENITINDNTYNTAGAITIKLNNIGEPQWVYASGGDATVTSVTVDQMGNVSLAGYYKAQENHFGTDTLGTSNFTESIVLVKIDEDGNHIWAEATGNSNADHKSIALFPDNKGGCYLAGNGGGPISFPGDTSFFGGSGGFVAHYNDTNWVDDARLIGFHVNGIKRENNTYYVAGQLENETNFGIDSFADPDIPSGIVGEFIYKKTTTSISNTGNDGP